MARKMNPGFDAYSTRYAPTHKNRKAAIMGVSTLRGIAPGIPEAVSISCCMVQERIRFSEPESSDPKTATQNKNLFLW